ncbi:hypothetical protein FB567DRAFT_294155 [Paraphoma chrysanthemicola]|uniref:Uncharacterized protein n=1 Tax=Paraphoma chrysanthemicola TaxID=798071 RepID=A0A8K0RA94_9PLEO|nr:hypothetical protein FB567DRAFT_294155 [Paraphoma chrysanthemicola]
MNDLPNCGCQISNGDLATLKQQFFASPWRGSIGSIIHSFGEAWWCWCWCERRKVSHDMGSRSFRSSARPADDECSSRTASVLTLRLGFSLWAGRVTGRGHTPTANVGQDRGGKSRKMTECSGPALSQITTDESCRRPLRSSAEGRGHAVNGYRSLGQVSQDHEGNRAHRLAACDPWFTRFVVRCAASDGAQCAGRVHWCAVRPRWAHSLRRRSRSRHHGRRWRAAGRQAPCMCRSHKGREAARSG